MMLSLILLIVSPISTDSDDFFLTASSFFILPPALPPCFPPLVCVAYLCLLTPLPSTHASTTYITGALKQITHNRTKNKEQVQINIIMRVIKFLLFAFSSFVVGLGAADSSSPSSSHLRQAPYQIISVSLPSHVSIVILNQLSFPLLLSSSPGAYDYYYQIILMMHQHPTSSSHQISYRWLIQPFNSIII